MNLHSRKEKPQFGACANMAHPFMRSGAYRPRALWLLNERAGPVFHDCVGRTPGAYLVQDGVGGLGKWNGRRGIDVTADAGGTNYYQAEVFRDVGMPNFSLFWLRVTFLEDITEAYRTYILLERAATPAVGGVGFFSCLTNNGNPVNTDFSPSYGNGSDFSRARIPNIWSAGRTYDIFMFRRSQSTSSAAVPVGTFAYSNGELIHTPTDFTLIGNNANIESANDGKFWYLGTRDNAQTLSPPSVRYEAFGIWENPQALIGATDVNTYYGVFSKWSADPWALVTDPLARKVYFDFGAASIASQAYHLRQQMRRR